MFSRETSNAKWTPSNEQEGCENGLETSQTGIVTRGGTFKTKDKSMTYCQRPQKAARDSEADGQELWLFSALLGLWTSTIDKNSSAGSKALAATIYRMLTCWMLHQSFANYGGSNWHRYLCYLIMSTMVVSLCMDARKPFLVSMMCHMAM